MFNLWSEGKNLEFWDQAAGLLSLSVDPVDPVGKNHSKGDWKIHPHRLGTLI